MVSGMFTPTYIWQAFKRQCHQSLTITYILNFHFVCFTFHINSVSNRMYTVSFYNFIFILYGSFSV